MRLDYVRCVALLCLLLLVCQCNVFLGRLMGHVCFVVVACVFASVVFSCCVSFCLRCVWLFCCCCCFVSFAFVCWCYFPVSLFCVFWNVVFV